MLQLLQGRGKVRVNLAKAFQDKNTMAAAFRTFLFGASPELKDIATKLAIQPEELSDKIHSVMQGAIYTWTEEQVVDKLDNVASEYQYLEAIGNVQGTVYHSIEAAQKDLASTLLDVQKKNHTVDTAVVSAINALRNMDNSILTDSKKIEDAFLKTVGTEYMDIWNSERTSILAKAKIQFGNDMSTWSIADLSSLQHILKKAQQEKAKKEKLAGTKAKVRNMKDTVLRDRVAAFLDEHPEFCDDFAD